MSHRKEARMQLEVTVDVDAPRAVVWDVLTDWEAQSDWMVDAKSVEVVSTALDGRGVTLHVPTNLLGVTVTDVMRVTGWEEPRYLEVTHLGRIISGRGAFELDVLDGGRTRVTWWEEVDPPLGTLGEWGARLVVKPFTQRLFRRSLRNLRDLAEQRGRSHP